MVPAGLMVIGRLYKDDGRVVVIRTITDSLLYAMVSPPGEPSAKEQWGIPVDAPVEEVPVRSDNGVCPACGCNDIRPLTADQRCDDGHLLYLATHACHNGPCGWRGTVAAAAVNRVIEDRQEAPVFSAIFSEPSHA
jgi:hypothetical protein